MLELARRLSVTHLDKWIIAWLVVLIVQASTSMLFGLRLLSEWGSDFGIYFVGGMSIDTEFGLYTGFFDHKGPLYFLFINILSTLIPYSPGGAALALGITCLIWFLSVGIGLRILQVPKQVQVLVSIAAIAVLMNQPSNASIALFAASFAFLAFASVIRFVESGQSAYAFSSFVLLGLAVLTRIDALAVLPLVILIGIGLRHPSNHQIRVVCIALLSGATVSFLVLIISSVRLNFGLADYWSQGIVFNFVTYPGWYGTGELTSHFASSVYLAQALLTTGLFSIWVLLLISGWSSLAPLRRQIALVLVLWTSLVFVATGSSKQYHLFIIYPALLISLAIGIPAVSKAWGRRIFAACLVLSIPTGLVIDSLVRESKCILGGFDACSNPYVDLVTEVNRTGVDNSEFFVNQGWPYLLIGRKPRVSFTPYFPLGKDLGKPTLKALEDAHQAGNQIIWINMEDFGYARQLPGQSVEEFLQGRVPLGDPVAGFTPMSPIYD